MLRCLTAIMLLAILVRILPSPAMACVASTDRQKHDGLKSRLGRVVMRIDAGTSLFCALSLEWKFARQLSATSTGASDGAPA